MTSPLARLRDDPTTRSAARFLVVGATNNLLMYGLFVLLTLRGIPPVPAATITYVLGMAISFVAHSRFTFRHRGDRGPAMIRFVLANVAGYLLNVGLLHLLITIGLPAVLAQLIAVVVVAALLFVAMKQWVFGSRRGRAQTDR